MAQNVSPNGIRVKIEWFIFLTIAPPINAFPLFTLFRETIRFVRANSDFAKCKRTIHYSLQSTIKVHLYWIVAFFVLFDALLRKNNIELQPNFPGSARKLIKVFPRDSSCYL